PITGEIRSQVGVGASPGVGESLHVLNRTQREVSLRIKSICVYKDQPQFPHQVWVLECPERWIGLSHEQWIVARQSGDELGINGEVIALQVTGPASPPIPAERLVQEKLSALGDQPREVSPSSQRGSGIETKLGARFIDESDLPSSEAIERGAGAGEY